MDQARDYVVAARRRGQALLGVLPEGPVREALEAFAEVVATRTA